MRVATQGAGDGGNGVPAARSAGSRRRGGYGRKPISDAVRFPGLSECAKARAGHLAPASPPSQPDHGMNIGGPRPVALGDLLRRLAPPGAAFGGNCGPPLWMAQSAPAAQQRAVVALTMASTPRW